MRNFSRMVGVMALLLLSACSTTQNQSTNVPAKDIATTPATQSGAKMSFFITSVNPGDGGNLGGLAGADAYCQKLASAV